ncbi:MAG: hypothetical protein IKT67_13135 [Lachnospiraceae bacterium]|nr:hypothetical protein [Lachnospiraceae bacterium]
MNQDSSFPPMLPPSTELGALLFAVLPCLQETYRPFAAFAYHMTELTRLKNIPAMPPLSGISGIDTFITDKDIMLRSLSFYGRMFRMPLLSAIATLLQGMQFYRTYKDILPGIFSGIGGAAQDPAAFERMAGLFSGLGGLGGTTGQGNPSPDLFSMLGGLSPDLLSSLFSGFSTASSTEKDTAASSSENNDTENSAEPSEQTEQTSTTATDDTMYNTLYSFLTPEQQKIYEQLMHTD